MFLTARNTLKLGHTKFLYPACSTIRLLFCTFFCVSALSIRLQCGGKAMFGAPVVSPSASACTAEETYSFTWDNENRSFTMRSEETNCRGFPDVSSSRVSWVWNHSTQTYHVAHKVTNEPMPMSMYHDIEVFCCVNARQACCSQKHFTGLKCVWILFSLAM